jgi:hypothetical protein
LDSFESLIAMLLKREGYWTAIGVKVELSKEEKRAIGVATTPRWEMDVVAYRGATNELLAVECKSFLDSTGVIFRNGQFEPPKRYKLFANETTRRVVLAKLGEQMVASSACAPNPTVTLCLAAGKIARKSDRLQMLEHFATHGWRLFDEDWVFSRLKTAATAGFENDVAHVVAKLILRRKAAAESG